MHICGKRQAWWHASLIPALGRQRLVDPWSLLANQARLVGVSNVSGKSNLGKWYLRIDSQGCLLTATYTQAWAPAHTWTYTSLETHAKQLECDDCIECLSWHPLLIWTLDNVRCLFTTWPQTYRSNDTSQWPVIKLFCVSLNILQHVLRMLLRLAIMVLIMHLSFTRANADTSELVFVLLLSRTQ